MLNSKTLQEPAPVQAPAHHLPAHWKPWVLGAAGLLLLAGIIRLLYAEENWRGKRVWERYKQSVEAAGGTLDWAAYKPPLPIRSEDNFFGTPHMIEWFRGRGGSSLSRRLETGLDAFLEQRDTNPVAEVIIVPPGARVQAAPSDIVLEYKLSVLSTPPATNESDWFAEEPQPVAPTITMDAVPLPDVVRNLGRQINLRVQFDSSLRADLEHPPVVRASWTNLTAEDALVRVLADYDLRLIPAPDGNGAVIKRRKAADSTIYATPPAVRQIETAAQSVIDAATNHAGPELFAVSGGSSMLLKSRPAIKPARIFVRASSIPMEIEVAQFFPNLPLPGPLAASYRTKMEPHVETVSGHEGTFRVFYRSHPCTGAADFLAWSSQFDPDFDELREALKQPNTQIPGNYEEPAGIPIPNFITVRFVSQQLCERAQCHLLLGEPELAWRDLSLVHDLCRLLEAAPTHKPMTLVAAMINVAVTGLYVDIIEDGLRLDAWREPQLEAIQEQLKQIDLLPYVVGSMEFERASVCTMLENVEAAHWHRTLTGNDWSNSLEKFKDPAELLLLFGPRGWTYQNMTTFGSRLDKVRETLNLKEHLVKARKADDLNQELSRGGDHRPYTLLADMLLPNYLRAWQTTSKNQTLANEALVVCALERHRLTHGQYPETLAQLDPHLLEHVPTDLFDGKPLRYRRTPDGQFVLYSIGWNETDDGGLAGKKNSDGFDFDTADWVWPYRQNLLK